MTQMTERLMEEFASSYMEKLFYFCLKKTGNSHDAEDLTSDIALNILSALEKGTLPTSFSAWVWRIARNRYSVWAERRHVARESVSGADVSEFEVADGDETLEEELIHRETLALLRRELAFISADYRNIVIAYYVDETRVQDIAKKLDLPEGTVKSKLFRARKILKEGMNMAREFGIRSYRPEDVDFSSSGSQPSGLPWSAVQRKIPKNILLAASNNPSTAEELAMELGVALPYMEEEISLLHKATLLDKVDDKYVTSFFIIDKQTRLSIYHALRLGSKQRTGLFDKIAEDSMESIRALGIAPNGMSDGDIKWFLMPHLIDFCVEHTEGYNIVYPRKRWGDETWGFIGYETVDMPENCGMGHNGCGNDDCMFWSYKINDWDMWNRAGEMGYSDTLLLGDIVRNGRRFDELSESEKSIWKKIDGRFAHVDEAGNIISDILIFREGVLDQLHRIFQNHPFFPQVMTLVKTAFNKTVDILKACSCEVLHKQLAYCASMEILQIRMMTLRDEVASGRLTLPEKPKQSTVAMWLHLK